MKKGVFFILFLVFFDALAQYNLISNPGFENNQSFPCNTRCPNPSMLGVSYQDVVDYWNMVGGWSPPKSVFYCYRRNVGSADCVCSEPHTGKYHGWGSGREYILTELPYKLDTSHLYYFECYAYKKKNDSHGIKFFEEKPWQCSYHRLYPDSHGEPQFEVLYTGDYGKISGYFTPDKAYKWMVLGSFPSANNDDGSCYWDDFILYDLGVDGCIPFWVFENTIEDNDRLYQTSDYITAGENTKPNHENGQVIIKANTHVVYRAGNNIFLEPGFETEYGADFEAVIEPCGSLCPYDNTIANNTIEICGTQPVEIGYPSVAGVLYNWIPSTYLDISNVSNPTFIPPPNTAGTITYNVKSNSAVCDFSGIATSFFQGNSTVTIHYNTFPLSSPNLSIQNINSDEYNISFDVHCDQQTEYIEVMVMNASETTVLWSKKYYRGSEFNCCVFHWKSIKEVSNVTICNDYKIKVKSKNYCSPEIYEYPTIVSWDKYQTDALILTVGNILTPPNMPLYAEVLGANTYSLEVFNRWGTLVYSNSGYVNDKIIELWQGECNTNICTSSTVNSSGTYFVILKVYGCDNSFEQHAGSVYLNWGNKHKVKIKTEGNKMSIFPNPAQNIITIEVSKKGEIIIYNQLMQEVYVSRISQKSTTITLNSFPKGLYYIKYLPEAGEPQIEKLILE